MLITLQMGVAVLVIQRFTLESRALLTVATAALIGFPVHALLPERARLPFFSLLSLAVLGIVLGPIAGVMLIGCGLALIAACHVPISIRGRVLLVLALGAAFAFARIDWIHVPRAGVIWPILGSMFMFRMIIYLYDLAHGEKQDSIWRTLSYFFLLPNVAMLLFPLVDYKTFRRTHYNDDPHRIYQIGVIWITRGIFHLLLYRVVYYYFVLAPNEVDSAGTLAQFMFANFALYLRVSGTFHIAIGILRLFGFNLPETHFFYFASSSINDFWRRINIYWKDFIQKLIYYPAFFKLRRSGATRAMVLSTLLAAVLSWMLHSYQWFWLRGTFPITWQDGFFWTLLGVMMIANTLYENRHARARGRRARSWQLSGALGQGARIAATFSFITVLWSVWTTESLAEWLAMWSFLGADSQTAAGSAPTRLAGFLPALVVLAALAAGQGGKGKGKGAMGPKHPPFLSSALRTLGALLAFLLLASPAVNSVLPSAVGDALKSLRSGRLNRHDAADLQRGYYEDLLDVDRFNSELWTAYSKRPTRWLELRQTRAQRNLDSFLLWGLEPSMQLLYKDALLSINRWGMRGRDYTQAKPPGTFRIAVVGASYVFGAGVLDDQTFQAQLEERLNREGPGAPETRYEVLNFGVPGYSPLQRLMSAEEKAFAFDPDAVIYVAHESELASLVRHLRRSLEEGVESPYPFVTDLMHEAQLEADSAPAIFERRLAPHHDEVLDFVYRRLVASSNERNIVPIWIYLPTIELYQLHTRLDDYVALAENSGLVSISLGGVYDDSNLEEIRIAPWDGHPNAVGHRIIADRIFEELSRRGPAIFGASP